MAGGILGDESEVDDPDQSAIDELGELRHDLTGAMFAGEAENQIFHWADAHSWSPFLAPASAERHYCKSGRTARQAVTREG